MRSMRKSEADGERSTARSWIETTWEEDVLHDTTTTFKSAAVLSSGQLVIADSKGV